MHHLTDKDRSQTFSTSLEASIGTDNPVRVIDAFVDALLLLEICSKGVEPKATGRPSFGPAHLLKLYLYGYYNRIRSSRKLELKGLHVINSCFSKSCRVKCKVFGYIKPRN